MDFTQVYRQSAYIVSFSPGAHFILNAVQDVLIVRRTDTLQITRTWSIPPDHPISHAGWSSDSEYLLAASAKAGLVQAFKLRDEAWSARIHTGAEGLVKAEWAPDGRHILCFSEWGVGAPAPSCLPMPTALTASSHYLVRCVRDRHLHPIPHPSRQRCVAPSHCSMPLNPSHRLCIPLRCSVFCIG